MLLKRAIAPVLLAVFASACVRHPAVVVNPAGAVERQAINAVDSGDGDYQIRSLRALVDADPRDLKSRLELAGRYRRLGFPEVAIEHVRLACERAPDSEEAHIALAKMLRDEGRSREGARLLGEFAGGHESGARVWAWIGLLRDDSGDWKAGEDAHRKALVLAPDHDDLHNNLGYCLLRQGRKAEAEVEFRAALRLNGASVVARNNLGTSLTADPKEAVGHLQSVTDAASAHNNLAVAFIEAGQYAEARREIELALGYNRHHSAALLNLQLVSQLDEKPAEIGLPALPEGRWSRMASAWHRYWAGGVPDSSNSSQSGSPVASR